MPDLPDLPVNLYDAKNMVERGARAVETKTRSVVGKVGQAIASKIPEGVKEGWREARGYRSKAQQRHGDIDLPREGIRKTARGRDRSRR
jgi:hypothetical protein